MKTLNPQIRYFAGINFTNQEIYKQRIRPSPLYATKGKKRGQTYFMGRKQKYSEV
ncbi:MAG: hypothetical protein LBV69_03120 [Bacteroidales bacterium]|jgi:hypothetical protein|nr:hypothetical protein [Bacteroidales bacterium]